MSRADKFLVVLVLASLGAWGCAQGPANNGQNAEKIKALETKIAKLEDDFKASVTIREQLRKKLAATEEDRGHLAQQVEQLQAVVKDRDDLRQQLAARTGERDAIQTQFDQFRKGIRNLLGQAEPAAAPQPVTSAAHPQGPGKS
jgi:septal ring factor EnvC (AmiA/AmiB activator)